MGNTPTYNLPYPELTSPADVPADIKGLANAVDALLQPAASVVRISDIKLTVAGTIDFTSIPQTHLHLFVFASIKSVTSGAGVPGGMRVNGDTGTNYFGNYMQVNNDAVAGGSILSGAMSQIGTISGSSGASFSPTLVFVPDYTRATVPEWISATFALGAGNAAGMWLNLRGGHYNSNAAVSRLTFLGADGSNLVAGSRATLYGLK